ncbi:MAG TPA: farnesyl diphosphate synthase [Thermoguttaceae bacterium]|nr:farnesyl diphosphate synthase [Thermoguttaceae bacterium]
MVDIATSTFVEYAGQLRGRIDAALAEYAELRDGCPGGLREAIRYSLLAPGKRLRPMLVLMAAEACGGAIDAALPAACAVEMVHAYSLVHDDLPAMDDDDLRRGQPACHKRFGEAVAILAGDGLLALAFQTLASDVHPPQVAAACCAMLAEAAGPCRLVGGQADDLAGSRAPATVDLLESIHDRKTGAMILASLRLGAAVAGATPEQTAALATYGRKLGLAFQITDDLLDVHGREAEMGKRVGKDADRGKLTFPALLGVAESARRAERLVLEACEALDPLGSRAGNLVALAHYVLERNR